MILHAVVADRPPGLLGRVGVAESRRQGRCALSLSARLAGAPLVSDVGGAFPRSPLPPGDWPGAAGLQPELEFPRNPTGAPLPRDGWHGSTSNTTGLVAAVVAPVPVAIDAEWLHRPRLRTLLPAFDEEELERVAALSAFAAPAALRVWTAKEAVVKLHGIGLAGLPDCRVEGLEGPDRVCVSYAGERHSVLQLLHGEHLLALACTAPGFEARVTRFEEVAV